MAIDESGLKSVYGEGWPDVAPALERLRQRYFMYEGPDYWNADRLLKHRQSCARKRIHAIAA